MLPQEFLDRVEKQLGREFPAFLDSLERPRAVALRFNPLKGEKPALPFVKEPVRIQRLQERPAPDRSQGENAWGFLTTALGGGFGASLAASRPTFCDSPLPSAPDPSLFSSETHPPATPQGQLHTVFQRSISSSLTRLSWR